MKRQIEHLASFSRWLLGRAVDDRTASMTNAGGFAMPRAPQPQAPGPLAKTRWDALQVTLAILLLLQVWRVQGAIRGVPLLGLPVLATVVAVLLLSLDRDPRRRLSGGREPLV